jgi:hypothetical protein
MMTARELIQAAAARNVKLRVDGERIRARGLTAEERTFLRDPVNARAVAALLALADVRKREADASEREEARLVAFANERAERERRRRRIEWLASLDEGRVTALAEVGRLTADDIATWREVRDIVQRLIARHWAAAQIAAELSRVVGRVMLRFEG